MIIDEREGRTVEKINLLEISRECDKEARKEFLNFIFNELTGMTDNDMERNLEDFYRDRKLKIIYMNKLYIQSNILILFNSKDSGLFFSNEFWAYKNKGTDKRQIPIETVQRIIGKLSEIILEEKEKRRETENFLKNNRTASQEKEVNSLLLEQITENIWL